MLDAVNNSKKTGPRGRPFKPGVGGNPRGRPKGSRNGMSPLAFLCSGYRDAKQPMKGRIEAAKCAAPYLHPKLSATPFSALQSELGPTPSIKIEFVTPLKPPED
jgi:hypothetical protein